MNPQASDPVYLSYTKVADILGRLIFGDDYKYELDPETRWVLQQTVRKTDPEVKALKAAGKPHPALLRTHPVIPAERVRQALIDKEVRDFKSSQVDRWFDKHKLIYHEIDDHSGQVEQGQIAVTIEREFKKDFQQLLTAEVRTTGDRPAKRGAPRQYPWDRAIAAVALSALRQPLNTKAEVSRKLLQWFTDHNYQEPAESTAKPYAKMLFEEIEKSVAPPLSSQQRLGAR